MHLGKPFLSKNVNVTSQLLLENGTNYGISPQYKAFFAWIVHRKMGVEIGEGIVKYSHFFYCLPLPLDISYWILQNSIHASFNNL